MGTLWDGLASSSAWVARASLQAGVLVLLILAAQALLRERLAPRWRYRLWLLLLVRLCLPWSPESPLSIYNLPSIIQEMHQRNPQPAVQVGVKMVQPVIEEHPAFHQVAKGLAAPPAAPSTPPGRTVSAPAWALALLPALWLAGVLFVAGGVLLQSLALGAAIRRRRPLTEQWVLELLEDCKEELGLHTYLSVVETDVVRTPALFGFVRPCLLLPVGAVAGLGPERLRHIFLHELTHLRRHDVAVGWLMAALQALHWFNPLLWYGFHRMRADRELACDAQVLERSRPDEPAAYGRTLIALMETFARPASAASLAGLMEDKTEMKRRIQMIASFHHGAARWSLVSTLILLTIGCATLTNPKTAKPGAAAGYKLALQSQSFAVESYPEGGGLYTMRVPILNSGSETSPAFDVYFYREPGGKPMENRGGPVKPGELFHEGCLPIALKEGINELSVVLDPQQKLPAATKLQDRATLKVEVRNGKIVDHPAPPAGTNEKIGPAEEFKVESHLAANGRIEDRIDYPFVNDPQAIGRWESVDFVSNMEQFTVGQKKWKGDLYLKELALYPDGNTNWAFTWTKGLVLHPGDKTASRYVIKSLNGAQYMFFEWKSGDYTFRHMKPKYYVLKKSDAQ